IRPPRCPLPRQRQPRNINASVSARPPNKARRRTGLSLSVSLSHTHTHTHTHTFFRDSPTPSFLSPPRLKANIPSPEQVQVFPVQTHLSFGRGAHGSVCVCVR